MVDNSAESGCAFEQFDALLSSFLIMLLSM